MGRGAAGTEGDTKLVTAVPRLHLSVVALVVCVRVALARVRRERLRWPRVSSGSVPIAVCVLGQRVRQVWGSGPCRGVCVDWVGGAAVGGPY